MAYRNSLANIFLSLQALPFYIIDKFVGYQKKKAHE